MKYAIDEYFKRLKKNKLRLTNPRISLLKVMQKGYHFSVKDLKKEIFGVCRATIYNNLYEFEKIGIVSTVKYNNMTVYELIASKTHHNSKFHAHLITKNNDVFDLDCNDVIKILKQRFDKYYKIDSITIEIKE